MTDTVNADGKVRMFADFDMFNRDILMNVLEKHLQKGYMLRHSNQLIGVLTFEPVTAGDNVTYAVIRPAQYENGGELPKPWVKCGRMGDYMIWRSTGAAYIPKPDKDPVEWERSSRNSHIFQGILWLLLCVFWLTTDVPIWSGSARGFSEYFGFRFLRDILMLVNGIGNLGIAFSKRDSNRNCTKRGKLKYFKQYIVPHIIIVLIIGLLPFALADIKEKKIPLPDSRLPFSEEFDSGRSAFLERSYAARNYIYNKTSDEDYMSCFLYEAYFDGLAPKIFDEIRDKGDVYSTKNCSGYPLSGIFISVKDAGFSDISDYPYLDDIIVCKEYDKYDGQHTFGGLIVRSGNSVFGIAYNKDKFSQDEILQYLNDFFAGS